MSVCFRVEKNENYTVMANYHLQDRRLSLKAIGLLSKMLSLPADWDYTISGLACICQEGKDAIRSALEELRKQDTSSVGSSMTKAAHSPGMSM